MRYWVLLLVLVLIGCAPATELPLVGVMAPLSGNFVAFGEIISKGVEDANQGRVTLIFEDTQCNNVQTTTGYKKLTEVDEVKYIIGPGCGSPQAIVASFIADKDQLVIVPSAAPINLFEVSNGKLFQIQYSLEKETAFMSDVIYNDGHKKAVLISYDNAFSQSHAESFKANYKGELLEEVKLTADDPTGVNLAITKIGVLQPDAVYIADLTFFLSNGLVKLREHEIDVPVYSMYIAEIPFARPLVEGVIYSYPGDISEEGGVYSLAKQAGEVLIDAIVSCNDEYSCVKETLENSDKFDENGISTRPIHLYEIKDGETVELE